ncbi:hypothetical protein Tco_0437209, partial [Tanacetum coccineum]
EIFDVSSFSATDFEYSNGKQTPLLPAMLLVASTNPNAGQEHDFVAPSQPSASTPPVPSTSSPPVQSPPPIPASIPTPTLLTPTRTGPRTNDYG